MNKRVMEIKYDDISDQTTIKTTKWWNYLTKTAKKDILNDLIPDLIQMDDDIKMSKVKE